MSRPKILDLRPISTSPIFSTDYLRGKQPSIKQDASAGDTVILHSGGLIVQVRITKFDNQEYTGEITGFTPWSAQADRDFPAGDSLSFTQQNIFGFNT